MAASAQVAVPVPFNPVPMTLQPLAVLAVGGLLGPAAGRRALVLYLALGMLGLPVFAGGSPGFVHVIGPTGGYLLAFPAAAAVAGTRHGAAADVFRALLDSARSPWSSFTSAACRNSRCSGEISPAAFRIGFVPFFTGDLLKVGLAAAADSRGRPKGSRAALTGAPPPSRFRSHPGDRGVVGFFLLGLLLFFIGVVPSRRGSPGG